MNLPDNLPPLPPVPDGFLRWEYRGIFWDSPDHCVHAVYYDDGEPWSVFSRCAHSGLLGESHYLEAVREPAKDQPASGEAADSITLRDDVREMTRRKNDEVAKLLQRDIHERLSRDEPATGVEARVCESPTPSRYRWTHEGVTFDFYRLCEILGITSHAQAHALKKVIRAGRGGKTLLQDIDEAIDAMRRFREMAEEDAPAESERRGRVCEDALEPFIKVARGIPDNWPGECILRFDQHQDGSLFLNYHGINDASNGITIEQWRALLPQPPEGGPEKP